MSDGEDEVLRDALKRRVDETGLRATAREVGLSPTGLKGVLNGSALYPRTRVAVREWLAALEAGNPPIGAAEKREMLQALTRHLPPGRQETMMERIERMIAEA